MQNFSLNNDRPKKSDFSIMLSLMNKTKFGKLKWQKLYKTGNTFKFRTHIDINEYKRMRIEYFINKEKMIFSYSYIYLESKKGLVKILDIDHKENLLITLLKDVIKNTE